MVPVFFLSAELPLSLESRPEPKLVRPRRQRTNSQVSCLLAFCCRRIGALSKLLKMPPSLIPTLDRRDIHLDPLGSQLSWIFVIPESLDKIRGLMPDRAIAGVVDRTAGLIHDCAGLF